MNYLSTHGKIKLFNPKFDCLKNYLPNFFFSLKSSFMLETHTTFTQVFL